MTPPARTSNRFPRLLSLALPFWRWIIASVVLGFLTVASSVALMTTAAWIISKAALHPPIADIMLAVTGVRFFGISRGVFRYLERLASHETTFRLLARLRVWFYRGLEPLAPARLQQFRSGDLLSRIIADVDTLEDFYVRVLAPPLVAVSVAAGLALFLATFAPVLAVIVLAFMLALGVGVPLLTRTLSRAPSRAVVEARADLNAALVDGLQGMADTVAYGRAADQLAHVRALSDALAARQTRIAWIDGLQAALGVALVSLAMVGVVAAAIPLVDPLNLASLALAVIAGFEAVLPLPQTAQLLESNLTAAGRLMTIIEGVSPAVVEPSTPAARPDRFDLVVENLRFAYSPDDPPALDGVSFTVAPGQRIAVVGPSGAGKSTLVNLLLRFWQADSGRMTVGGVDLRDLPGDDVRALIGVVTQHTHLFNTTIRENLLIANPHAEESAMIAAAQQAQIHAFVESLPDGYDTQVGEMGLGLSGGERQRIAIARALLKDAPILVLDEATANLDSVTENAVLDAVRALMAGRTTLIITHRLVGLEDADEILVLDGGRVVERGRHDDLLARADGLYRRLWRQQDLTP